MSRVQSWKKADLPDESIQNAVVAAQSGQALLGSSASDEPAGSSARTTAIGVRQERRRRRRSRARDAVLEWIVAIALALGAALLIKTYAIQAFVIPSESMLPTLEKQDRVLVSKFAYRVSDIHRGDVLVFKNPTPPERRAPNEPGQLIKRVVALEGDTVESVGGKLQVNGRPADEPFIIAGARTDDCCTKWLDDPAAGKTVAAQGTTVGQNGQITVPVGTVFVMGDNRPNSKDSRFIGPINRKLIVGKAFLRIWPPNRLGRL